MSVLSLKHPIFLPLKTPILWAVLFLSPLYIGVLLSNVPKTLALLESILAPLSLWACLRLNAKQRFLFGLFVGFGMFYWTALSFRYNAYPFFMPFIALLVACCYGGLFYLLLFKQSLLYRVPMLWLSSYIHPFGFDWFVPDAFFAYSLFRVDKLSFFVILCALALLVQKRLNPLYANIVAGLLLVCTLQMPKSAPPLKGVEPISTQINQENKWSSTDLKATMDANFTLINQAIAKHQKAVVLPETAFPIALNKSPLIPILAQLSQNTTIIAGALYEEGNTIYNSTYIFDKGKYHYAHKVILAPFGESMPLPDFIANALDRFFFGPEVFKLGHAKDFSDFHTSALHLRPLVCYEGTSAKAYINSPPYLVVISNNAWFVPSIEPFFQRMLLKYYARRFHKTIIHSTNKSPAYILSPTLFGDQVFK
ncbi:Apolipoprotein N-acyltransferase [Helicobacter heilmannii]|uniref:apolipoprotein N-acyltransferase n=1 Tax=Helicobacter heilmannii TaxID=35817 RepID=UPI0006A10A98|nr:apolipoprotein N-acyltransferase [Helicobacter heilmannii]CRF51133.1 Apolipoprotein N-acyltransferase [Helicobacter heilmannii]